ncbi:MAG: DDE-type integrase/transposase/recombinase, partial [Bacteroidota bacterium]
LLVDRRIDNINQVWVSDLFYLELPDEHLYVVLITDVYSRRVIGTAGGNHMRAELFVTALNRALTLRGVADYGGGLIHHSDRGSQYASHAYTEQLIHYGIQISMCRTVLENAHAERVNGTIKNDYLRHFTGVRSTNIDRYALLAAERYNVRFHDSLGMPPLDYEAWLTTVAPEKRPGLQVYTEANTQKMNNHGQLNLFELSD